MWKAFKKLFKIALMLVFVVGIIATVFYYLHGKEIEEIEEIFDDHEGLEDVEPTDKTSPYFDTIKNKLKAATNTMSYFRDRSYTTLEHQSHPDED